MNVKKTVRTGLFFILALIIAFLIYSLTPRVFHAESSYGLPLNQSTELSQKFQKQLRGFINDSASRMQSIVVLHEGDIIFEQGDIARPINCHSARKSIMSLLMGIARQKGLLSLDETLEELEIDESKTPLTKQEKSATIRDLLMARSGVYLQAEAEVDYAKSNRPKREQYKPGEFFFYNNFDFNVLGAILEQKTGKSIGEFMEENLAKPLGMQDFSASNVVYNNPWPVPNKSSSDYPVYWIYMSARDFAKIGLLITQNGRWKGNQVVPSEWINISLADHTVLSEKMVKMNYPYDAFAYSWWLENDTNTIWADGYGGQFLCIDTTNNLVVVQRNFTGNSLLSSGLFLMDKERDNNPKSELIHIYKMVLSDVKRR